MTDALMFLSCGVIAGVLGGYLGLGGGIIIVPFLTLLKGMDIKAAVPASMAAIVVNSLASSAEYVKKEMVDFRLVVILSLSMVLGTVIGSTIMPSVPGSVVRLLLAGVLVYTAISFVSGKGGGNGHPASQTRQRYLLASFISFSGGVLASIVGIGGGVIAVPIMFFLLGTSLATARGTSTFIVGFASASSVAVYLLNGMVPLQAVSPLMLGTLIGGKLGGYLGTAAKPKAVRLVFFLVLLYVAGRMVYQSYGEWQ